MCPWSRTSPGGGILPARPGEGATHHTDLLKLEPRKFGSGYEVGQRCLPSEPYPHLDCTPWMQFPPQSYLLRIISSSIGIAQLQSQPIQSSDRDSHYDARRRYSGIPSREMLPFGDSRAMSR
jgi:hypothetical protein